ncbi:hypothetical protein BH24ACT15_BH24ACT15_02370 [soil metagenome]
MKDLSPKAERTREGLLDTAEKMLVEGTDLVSSVVAERAGVATGTFYRYFDDKDELLAAAFARRMDELITTVEQTLAPTQVLDLGVRAVLDGLVVELADQYMRTGPMLAAARARMTASDDIRLVYRARHDRAVDVFLTFLRRIHRVGLVDVEDVSATALAAVVLVQALNHPALAEDTQGYIRTGVQRALRALILGTP